MSIWPADRSAPAGRPADYAESHNLGSASCSDVFPEVGMRPVLPCTWVICYRAANGRPRNPSITLANTSLEHGLLLFEAKQSTAYVTKRSLRTHVPYSCLHDRQLLCGVCRHRAPSVGSFMWASAGGAVARWSPCGTTATEGAATSLA